MALNLTKPGEPGPQGQQGPDGQPGAVGPQGPQGDQGPVGGIGPEGPEGQPGPIGPEGADGTGFQWKGAWNVATAYVVGDVVFHDADPDDFTSFIAVEAHTGVTPVNTADEWDGITIAGPAGPQGQSGTVGPQGPQGVQGPVGQQGPAGSTVSNALQGAPDRFYKVVAGVLRNPGSGDFWQPVADTTNRSQNIDDVTTDTSKVVVDFTEMDATRVGSFVATPDDVLAAAGIKLAIKPTITTAEITFLQDRKFSDFLSYDGTAWVKGKGGSSPFTLAGLVNENADFPAVVLATADLTAFFRLSETSGTTLDTTPAGLTGSVVGSVSYAQPGALQADPANKAIKTTGLATSDITVPGGAITQAAFSLLWIGKMAASSTVLFRDNTGAIGTGYSVSSSGGGTPTVVYRMGSSGATYTTTYPWTSLIDGNFHSVLVTKNGVNAALYIDGALVHSATTASSTAIANTWHFGRNGTTTPYVENTTDEVAFFARALTGAEALELHKTAFADGILTITHGDLGTTDPTDISIVPQGGKYRIVVDSAAGSLTSTGVHLAFYDAATGDQALAVDTDMRFALSRSTTNRVLNPQQVSTVTFPNSDIYVYGMFEVPQPIFAPPDPPTPPDPVELPEGDIGFSASRKVGMLSYRATFGDSDSFWRRELPDTVPERNALLFQHATQPTANSATWGRNLCEQMGFDYDTPGDPPGIPNHIPGWSNGWAWLGREGHGLCIVPPEQPYRDMSVVNPDNTPATASFHVHLQQRIDAAGGVPLPLDAEGQGGGDRYIHCWKPDDGLYFEGYAISALDPAWTDIFLTGSPAGGEIVLDVDYGDNDKATSRYVTGPIPYNATAAQMKTALDNAKNSAGTTLFGGNTGKCTCTGGPLNVAPIRAQFVLQHPLTATFMQVHFSSLTSGSVGFDFHVSGPADRIRGGALIAPHAPVSYPGMPGHPGVYRSFTAPGPGGTPPSGFFWEDSGWGGSATGMNFMQGMPSWDEYAEALENETNLGYALVMITGRAQTSPIIRVQPAIRSDGDVVGATWICEGARVALPPDIDLSFFQATYPEWMPILRTLRDFGAIIYDKTGPHPNGPYLQFRKAAWVGDTYNPWFDLLPMYAQFPGDAAHRYMRAIPWQKIQVIDPEFSRP